MKEQKQEETETPQITFEAAAAGCGTSGIYRFYHGTYYLGWYLGTLSAVSFLLSPTAVSLRLSAPRPPFPWTPPKSELRPGGREKEGRR